MKKYLAFFKNRFANTVIYRGTIFLWIGANALSAWVMIAVWQASQAGQTIGGYTRNELITYYVLSVFFQGVLTWMPFYSVSQEIRDGEISLQSLLKPLSFYWRKFFEEAGWHSVSSILRTLSLLFFALFFVRSLTLAFSLSQIVLVFLAMILAIFTIFEFSLCLGLFSFWLTDVWILDSLFWAARGLLGGQVLPLSFIPSHFQSLVRFLPFRYTFSFPLEIYFGKLSNTEILIGVAVALCWIFFFAWLYRFLWEGGRKIYASFGN